MAKNSANKLMKEMQQIAANAQVEVQRLANEATQKSFDYNAKEANTARDWQKMMSDTAHQREVTDLKKAGLNPVLAANQGAQSYTTSSASAQANDPSGSIGALAGNLMQSRTGAYQADVSAQATRAAAAQSAAATKYAAAQAASAQRYAAAMHYATQKDSWKWKTDYMKAEYKAKGDLILKTPVGNVAGLIDKYVTKAGIADVAVSSNTIKGVKNFVSGVLNNPAKLFKDNVTAAKNDYSKLITKDGSQRVNKYLKNFGLAQNKTNRNLFINAFVFGKSPAFSLLLSRMPKKNRTLYTNNVSRMMNIR